MSEGTDSLLGYDYENYIIKLKRNQMVIGTGVINIYLCWRGHRWLLCEICFDLVLEV